MSTEAIINEMIKAKTVRLIGVDGEQLGIQQTEEARRLAFEAGVDLVLVSPNADPPVARVMDYGKFKYEQKKRQHEHHKHQPQVKELRFRPKTEDHDLQVRVKQAREFIARGDRVLVNVRFRGREMAHTDLGYEVMTKFTKALEDVAKLEHPPSMMGRQISAVFMKK